MKLYLVYFDYSSSFSEGNTSLSLFSNNEASALATARAVCTMTLPGCKITNIGITCLSTQFDQKGDTQFSTISQPNP